MKDSTKDLEKVSTIDLKHIDLLLHRVESGALEVVGASMKLQKEITAILERIEAGRACDPKRN